MKHLANYCLIAIIITLSSCAGCNRVAPNYEGVLMENCGRNGKEDFKKVTGSQGMLGPCSELFQVPMFEQSADPNATIVTSKDGGAFTVDPSYTYQALRGAGIDIVFNYKHVLNDSAGNLMDNIENSILNRIVMDSYREEARNYSTDSLMTNMNVFEHAVEKVLLDKFKTKYFSLLSLTSGLKPPQVMIDAVNQRNVAKETSKKVENELQTARMNLEKAKIDAEANRVRAAGLDSKVLQEQWIEAIRNTNNKVIITDGRTPVIFQQ